MARKKENKLFIPILLGTTRPKRRSYNVARLIYEIGKKTRGIDVELVDPMDYKFPYDGNDYENKDPRYTKLTKKADAFFIVTPEYNHGYPGSLKRMLDSELSNYIHKPVAFAGVSETIWGGVRVIEALVQTVREMGMMASFTDVHFPQVQNLFDEKGKLADKDFVKRVERSYEELIWLAKAMRYGRENLGGPYHKTTK